MKAMGATSNPTKARGGSPKLSVVIPAYNEAAGLRDCVTRLRVALARVESVLAVAEIIVCNNNSTDATAAIAEELGCHVVFEPVNQISRARNRGASAASGDWLLFLDADSWPSPELMEDAVRAMGEGTVIGCGSTIRIVDGPWWFRAAWESKNLSMRLLKWCPGGFIVCRREAFTAIGGFPLDHYIFEEADFVKRLKKHGAERGQKFIVLHRHPFNASGRKGIEFGFWSWVRTAIRFWISPKKLVRDKAFAKKWYASER
jgi:glycosyltransferase involved in cell wall biosynthesis